MVSELQQSYIEMFGREWIKVFLLFNENRTQYNQIQPTIKGQLRSCSMPVRRSILAGTDSLNVARAEDHQVIVRLLKEAGAEEVEDPISPAEYPHPSFLP